MNPLELHDVVKHYPGFTLDITMTVPHGYVTGFVGANGSGKTSTIKTALGLVHPDAGRLQAVDHARIGVVLDQPPYNPESSVALIGRLLDGFFPAWDENRFRALTEQWEVPATRRVKELSRGMGMKLQLAAALSHDAEFLILDEPTSGIDPFARDELLDTLAEFMTDETHSVLFSTHITSDLDRIADRVVLLDHGRVVPATDKDTLLEDYRLVSGGPDDLAEEIRPHLIGLRTHTHGWDALANSDDAASLGRVQVERPTLDDVVVRIAKEHSHA